MPPAEFSPPAEIPWRLASTTQVLKAKDASPDDATVSLFYYEPTLDSLDRDYPDHRLIYLRVSVSVSAFNLDPATLTQWGFSGWLQQLLIKSYLRGGLPLWHLLLDMVVTPRPFAEGGIEPYFHAASPLRREMIETGVIGNDLFEGSAEGVAFGKSASQMHETVSSRTRTKSKGFGIGTGRLPGPSFSVGSTSTAVDSERHVDQTVETTMREASTERRELLSHVTNVENVLTLLTAQHVGSPYLRFSLWPRPLRLLSVDASDPNLWYQELLYRRSRGIEGVQDFLAVLVVPRDEGFCLHLRLMRFGILEAPPARPRLPRLGPTAGPGSLHDRATMFDKLETGLYLHEKYPVGYPLDLLDVDVIDQIEAAKHEKYFPRPAVSWWATGVNDGYGWDQTPSAVVTVGFSSPATNDAGQADSHAWGNAYYKDFNQVQYEREEEEYQRRLEASPLERGKVIVKEHALDTCFAWAEGGRLDVVPGISWKMSEGAIDAGVELGFPQPHRARVPDWSGAARYRSVMLRWTRLQDELARRLSGMEAPRIEALRPDDPAVVMLALDILADLEPDDPLNVGLQDAVTLLDLSAKHRRMLETAGVTDLRGAARVVRSAGRIAAHQAGVGAFVEGLSDRDRCRVHVRATEVPWSGDDAARLLERFRRALAHRRRGDARKGREAEGGREPDEPEGNGGEEGG